MSHAVNKLEIADEFLESAIEDYLDRCRYFSALNSAGAAQELYGKSIRMTGGQDFHSQVLETILSTVSKSGIDTPALKDFKKQASIPKNSIKHLDGPSDKYTSFDVKINSFLKIGEAIIDRDQIGRTPTKNTERFKFIMNNPSGNK